MLDEFMLHLLQDQMAGKSSTGAFDKCSESSQSHEENCTGTPDTSA